MSTTATAAAPAVEPEPADVADELAERLFEAGLGAFELALVTLGARLGLYRALDDRGRPQTAPELAAATGLDARYLREWCEQQAVAGILTVDDPGAAPDRRRFGMRPGAAAVLLDPESPAFLVPLGEFSCTVGRMLPALQDAFGSGAGIPYADYEVQHAQGAFNRPAFTGQLVQEWLPLVPDLHARLTAGGTVAEFGCGEGWAAIALARGYPNLGVDAFDDDPRSIEAARRNVERAGLGDRVRCVVADVTDPALTGSFDAVFAFEMVHDLADPVAALRSARRLTGAGAAPVIVMDERAAERFGAPGDPVERFLYAASVLHCLPVGRCAEPSAATGTVMRPDTLRGYAAEAGFAGVTVLPIENDLFRFYRLEG
jgi:SAM-dependent methyltransferase